MSYSDVTNAAYCIYELSGFLSPQEVTADWVYVRLHGPAGKYQGSYRSDVLDEWAYRIVGWSTRLKVIYIYFDNDESAYSVHNALELKRLVDQRLSTGDLEGQLKLRSALSSRQGSTQDPLLRKSQIVKITNLGFSIT